MATVTLKGGDFEPCSPGSGAGRNTRYLFGSFQPVLGLRPPWMIASAPSPSQPLEAPGRCWSRIILLAWQWSPTLARLVARRSSQSVFG